MTDAAHTLAQEFDAAIEWWNASGVDCDFTDDATAWLADATEDGNPAEAAAKHSGKDRKPSTVAAAPEQKSQSEVERINLLGDSPPQTLEEFREFWMTAPGLDAIGPRGRVPPRGRQGSALMILVVEPEEVDTDVLLSGQQGSLLTRMLNAMGVSEDETYIASALPRPTPMADTATIAVGGMDAVTAHHIKLVAPQRVIAFGGNILPLIGHELPKDALSLREINLVNPPIPLLMSEGLESLMAMPGLKARFWRRWIEWSAGR